MEITLLFLDSTNWKTCGIEANNTLLVIVIQLK